MKAYLDNSATTACNEQVAELVVKLMTKEYGNPSSMHKLGFEAEKELKNAREILAKIWKVSEQEIIFTSGGTEADNMALWGAASRNSRQGKHIVTTMVEHAAISATCEALKKQGYEITYLSVDREGVISLDELRASIRPDTILVSIMHVNNEIGSVQPIEEAGRIIKELNPKCLFHVDDIQGYGKLSLYPKRMKIDMISVSGHKLHGPKGTGVLYVSKDAKINPLIYGGGQQRDMRSGTENVPGYAGLALAAKLSTENLAESTRRLYELREWFVNKLEELDEVKVNGPKYIGGEFSQEKIAPHIVSLSVRGVRAEVLLHSLEDRDVFVSAGSACSSNKPAVSKTLTAIGIDRDLLDSTVRFSFGLSTTKEELEYAYETLSEILPVLRRYTRKK